MKFLSALILLAIVFGSWVGVNAPAAVSVVTHAGLQENLRQLITQKIHEMLPGATDVRFQNLYTRAVNENKVVATFVYSFNHSPDGEGPTKTTLSGHAELSREPATDANGESTWSFDNVEINGQEIEFADDTVIQGSPKAEAEVPNVPPNEAPVEAPAAQQQQDHSSASHE